MQHCVIVTTKREGQRDLVETLMARHKQDADMLVDLLRADEHRIPEAGVIIHGPRGRVVLTASDCEAIVSQFAPDRLRKFGIAG